MEFGKKLTTPPEDEPKADWDPDEVLTRAQQMMQLKESIYMKAHANIKQAQEKDKHYYDLKHSNPMQVYNLQYLSGILMWTIIIYKKYPFCVSTVCSWCYGTDAKQQEG